MNLSPFTDALVGAAAMAVTTLAGMMMPMLPRLWIWLRVRINGADAELVRHALANAATNAVPAVRGGQPMHRAVDEIVAYVQANLPRALARLKVPPETLHLMAQAALARELG